MEKNKTGLVGVAVHKNSVLGDGNGHYCGRVEIFSEDYILRAEYFARFQYAEKIAKKIASSLSIPYLGVFVRSPEDLRNVKSTGVYGKLRT